MIGKLTPQERIRLAKGLNKQSKNAKLTPQQRANKRRLASVLIKLNEIAAQRSSRRLTDDEIASLRDDARRASRRLELLIARDKAWRSPASD
jgi:hypothetical protein